jgi:hypothetical protein
MRVGMPTRDVRAYLPETHGVEVSPNLISRVTDAREGPTEAVGNNGEAVNAAA